MQVRILSRRYSSSTKSRATVYGHVAADLTVVALEKAGKDLTLDSFVKAMESIKGYKDIFQQPRGELRPRQTPGRERVVPGGREGRALGARDQAAELLRSPPRASPGLARRAAFSPGCAGIVRGRRTGYDSDAAQISDG